MKKWCALCGFLLAQFAETFHKGLSSSIPFSGFVDKRIDCFIILGTIRRNVVLLFS